MAIQIARSTKRLRTKIQKLCTDPSYIKQSLKSGCFFVILVVKGPVIVRLRVK